MEFSREHLKFEKEWGTLQVPSDTLHQIREIVRGIRENKSAYRALFCGPQGSGKTLAASLLGKETGNEVYRIDLSTVTSKYIEETEKNLSKVFSQAENKNWILYFDEADDLFSGRSDIHDAHDNYANQEVAFLLQRIESYNGLVIVASNCRRNIDEDFAKRFQAVINFPKPLPDDRHKIWIKAMPPG
jgi:SpoVK/Ycf46/Vps4 family AAA+-type ATPase